MATAFLQIHAKPNRTWTLTLSYFLFAASILAYFYTAAMRHRDNPDERVTPSIQQMAQRFKFVATNPAPDDLDLPENATLSERIFGSMLWRDTRASARRFGMSMIFLFPAVILGMHMALFPYIGVFFLRFVLFFDKIVALSLLPILFVAFGIDELAKVMLIVIGVTPTVILDAFNLTKGVPPEQVVKAFTLGADDFEIAYRVVLKQIWPRVLNSIRLNLKAVMLFLFAGEMIASSDGLAYRIGVSGRQMQMDLIIPYVLWVALLLFLVDFGMRTANRLLHPWFREV